MKIIAHYLPVILLCLFATPCFSAHLLQETKGSGSSDTWHPINHLHVDQAGKNKTLEDTSDKDSFEVLKYLLPHASQEGKDIALKLGVEKANLKIVKLFLSDASQSAKNYALRNAARNGHLEVVEIIAPKVEQEAHLF